MELPNPQKENPDSVAAEIGVEGIEALPGKVSRYGKAKKGALDVADYMESNTEHKQLAQRLKTCGDYLVFRHYFTVDKVRLHGASLCKKHLLCPLCAIRRGAKALKSYLDRWECIRAENPRLKPYLITLTVKDGDDLAERFQHLYKSQHELWKRRARKYETTLDCVDGAVWSYEIKRGKNSGAWHPHLHMIALAENLPIEGAGNLGALSDEWKAITGDSHMVDVRPISQDDPVSGFLEVFKYAVKFSDQSPADTVHAWETLQGRRLIGCAGSFRGVVVPDNLLDEPGDYEGLPYWSYFYAYLAAGYSLAKRSYGTEGTLKKPKFVGPPKPRSEKHLLWDAVHHRMMKEKLTLRALPGGYGPRAM
jgi:hypothetical protein